MRDSALGRLALAARHPPLWARWLLTIVAFAVLIVLAIVVVRQHSEVTSAPTKSEREAEVQANREGDIVIEEDQAPHTASLSAGVPTLTALQREIAGDARARIQTGELTGPFQSVRCKAGHVVGANRAYSCSVRAAGVTYPYVALLDTRTRRLTWCKIDPPPTGGAPEVPVSPRCRL